MRDSAPANVVPSSITMAPADFPAILLSGHDLRISPLSKSRRPSCIEFLALGTSFGITETPRRSAPQLLLSIFAPELSTLVSMASGGRSSPRRPYPLLRTELPRHRRPLLPSSPRPTGVRYPRSAFSIPRRAPIESTQSVESWSCRRANPFRSTSPPAPD